MIHVEGGNGDEFGEWEYLVEMWFQSGVCNIQQLVAYVSKSYYFEVQVDDINYWCYRSVVCFWDWASVQGGDYILKFDDRVESVWDELSISGILCNGDGSVYL